MLKQIDIENFRGFEKLELPVDRVSVLLGPNNSGKTTILHAVRLACQAMELALESEGSVKVDGETIVVAKNLLIEAPALLLPLADRYAFFINQAVQDGTTFSIRLHFEDTDALQLLELAISFGRNKQLMLSLWVKAAAALDEVSGLPKKSPKINWKLSEYLHKHAPTAVFIPPFYGVVKDEEYRMKVVVDHLVGSGDQSHVVRNLITGLEPEQLKQLNAFLLELTDASITYRTSGDKVQTENPLRVEYKDTNGAIEISAAGAGFVNLVALFSSLARWQAQARDKLILFLLDEPEAHLHPRLQGETARRIASLVTEEFGAQLLMATHSVEIINRLGGEKGVTLVRTDRTQRPAATLLGSQHDILDALGPWVDLTPFTAINFLASRRVLFHEGPSDATVLRQCANTLFRQKPEKKQAFDRWTLVPLDGSGNDKLPSWIRRLLKSQAWATSQDQAPFHLVTLLDRDHGRTPGWQQEVREGPVQARTFVWSRYSIESLFLETKLLAYWIQAYSGPVNQQALEAAIAAAIVAVDQDDELNQDAKDHLFLYLKQTALQDAKGKALSIGSDEHALYAMRQARELVSIAPAIYQRGKDRSRRLLGIIRESPLLENPARNQFTTDLPNLLSRTNNPISDPVLSIPAEIRDLLEVMTTP